jgi:hypothetical protein
MLASLGTEHALRNSTVKTAAKLSFWSPFAAGLSMAPVVALSELWDIHPMWAVWVSFAVCCLLILSGFVLGVVALVRMAQHGRKGVLGRAATGVCLNFVLICLISAGLPAITSQEVARRERQAAEGQYVSPALRIELSMTHIAKLEASLEKEAKIRTNDDAILFRALSDVMRNEHSNMSNYYAAVEPLMHGHILNTAGIQRPADLTQRQTMVLKFLLANSAVSNYCVSFSNDFRASLVNGGYPKSKVEEETVSMGKSWTNLSQTMPMWEANNRWAESELRGLGLLISNWSNWSYDESLKKTVFKTTDLQTEFDGIVHDINADVKERTRLQKQFQLGLKKKS